SSDALPAALPASDAIGTRDSVSDKPRVTIGQVEREAHARRGPNPDRGVVPKRGYVTQRSGGTHLAKIKSCRAFREGALSNCQNPKVPPTGGFTTAAYLSGPAPADAR